MRGNKQNVVLNESSEAFGNRLEIVRIFILAMTTSDDGESGGNFAREAAARFPLLYKQNCDFWCRFLVR